jgi:hypothetical protein
MSMMDQRQAEMQDLVHNSIIRIIHVPVLGCMILRFHSAEPTILCLRLYYFITIITIVNVYLFELGIGFYQVAVVLQ